MSAPDARLRQLRHLALVVARGSFEAAAREAGVTASAVSHAMRTLEQTWGTPLFIKAGRRRVPTLAARAVAQRVSDLLGRLDRLADPVGQAPAPLAHGLVVGMAPAAALLYGGTVQDVWHAQEPQGTLQIVSGGALELLAALEDGALDLALVPRPRRYARAGIVHHALHTSQPVVHARAGHPLAGARHLRELHGAGWAVTGRGGTPGHVIEEALRVRQLPAAHVLLQCADYRTLLERVAASDLLCVVPHPVLVPVSMRPALAALALHEGLPQYEVCVFWRTDAGADVHPAVGAIVQALGG